MQVTLINMIKLLIENRTSKDNFKSAMEHMITVSAKNCGLLEWENNAVSTAVGTLSCH